MKKDRIYQNNQIVNSKYTIVRFLGSGQFGEVFEVCQEDEITKEVESLAMKVIPKDQFEEIPKLEELYEVERSILMKINNPNVLRAFDDFESKDNMHLITELCEDGDLEQQLNKEKNQRISENAARQFFVQVINGLQQIHQLKIIHRDLQPDNLFLHKGIIQIADLGFAQQLQESDLASTSLGTPHYMAPQIMEYKDYGFKADMFSLGVILFKMVIGKYPFNGYDEKTLFKAQKEGKIDFGTVSVSDQFQELVSRMLKYKVEERIDFPDLFVHPFVKNIGNREQLDQTVGFEHLRQNKNQIDLNSNTYREQPNQFPEMIQVSDFQYQVSSLDTEEAILKSQLNTNDSIMNKMSELRLQQSDIKNSVLQYSKSNKSKIRGDELDERPQEESQYDTNFQKSNLQPEKKSVVDKSNSKIIEAIKRQQTIETVSRNVVTKLLEDKNQISFLVKILFQCYKNTQYIQSNDVCFLIIQKVNLMHNNLLSKLKRLEDLKIDLEDVPVKSIMEYEEFKELQQLIQNSTETFNLYYMDLKYNLDDSRKQLSQEMIKELDQEDLTQLYNKNINDCVKNFYGKLLIVNKSNGELKRDKNFKNTLILQNYVFDFIEHEKFINSDEINNLQTYYQDIENSDIKKLQEIIEVKAKRLLKE